MMGTVPTDIKNSYAVMLEINYTVRGCKNLHFFTGMVGRSSGRAGSMEYYSAHIKLKSL